MPLPDGCFSVPRMLDDFSHELDSTQSRLDNVMKKLAKVSHMTSGRSWEVGSIPGKGETSLWIFRLGHCVLPPTDRQPSPEPRGGSSSLCLEEGEEFQALQLLLPRHCSAACPLPLFYLQMPFYLCCCCCGEKTPLWMVGGEALQPPPLLQFPGLPGEQSVWLPLWQAPFQTPLALRLLAPAGPQACCRSDISRLAEERVDFCAEPMRKILIRPCLKPVGWRGAAGRANRKPDVPAGKSPATSSPLRALAVRPAVTSARAPLPRVLAEAAARREEK